MELTTLNADDFDSIKAEISAPYQPGQSIRTVLANQVIRNLRILKEQGQPLCDLDAVQLIQSKFDPVVFKDCWMDYARTNGPISLKSPDSLVKALICICQ